MVRLTDCRHRIGALAADHDHRLGRTRVVPRVMGLALALALGAGAGTGRLAAQDEGPLPRPAARNGYTVEQDIMVPMRDGVRLATNVYQPTTGGPRFPVVLLRTPYSKDARSVTAGAGKFFAEQGYVVVVQDLRGKFRSEGDFTVQVNDADDGWDTMDWIVKQPWATGKVGTYGCSYLGEVQLLLAKRRHPNLTAMIPQSATGAMGPAGGYYTNWGTYEGGTVTLSALFGWMGGAGSKEKGKTVDRATLDFAAMLRSLPVATMTERAGYPASDFRDFVTHLPADPYWDRMGYIRDDDRFGVPALHVNSWFDVTPEQTLYLFNLMRQNAPSTRARDNQFVIMSPTSHCASEAAGNPTRVGDRTFGDGRLDYWTIYRDWFDYWLKGIENGITRRPRIQYYLTGANQWRESAAWPVSGARATTWYLTADRGANAASGDGRLTLEKPARSRRDTVRYDPNDPLPSRGGTVCCTGNPKDQPGAFDQSDLESRQDLLIYTSAPLERGVTVTGSIRADLYVSSDRKDTDFAAKLIDVDPEGRSWNVANGILRARYREGMTKQVWLTPGQVVRLEVNLKAIAHRFAPGHRIRLWISGSDFPLHDRNLNTGGDNVTETAWLVATNAVHTGGATASRLVLPVVPER